MATHEAQGDPPGEQGRRIGLRARKTVDYVQAAQGYTKDDEGDEDYVQGEVTPDEEERIEVEEENEEAHDTEKGEEDDEEVEILDGDKEAKDTQEEDDEDEEKEAKGLEEDDEEVEKDTEDDEEANDVEKQDEDVEGDEDLLGGEDDGERAKDAIAEDNDNAKGSGNKRQVTAFEESILRFVRAAREEAEAEAAARAPTTIHKADVPSTTARAKAQAPKRKPSPGRSAVGASPPKRAKVGRKEKQQLVVTAAADQPAARHRERRRTKTWDKREKIVQTHKPVDNLTPPLAKKSFADWGEFERALNAYQDANLVLYRVRSSQSKAKHDSLPGVQMLPNNFTHKFKSMWCTHGAKQSSRGEGLRESGQRYTGCEASFTVRSVKYVEKGVSKWKVCIDPDTEIYMHNHKTTKTIYESYKRGKSLPLTPAVCKDLSLMVKMQTRTPAINRYLADKLGGCSW